MADDNDLYRRPDADLTPPASHEPGTVGEPRKLPAGAGWDWVVQAWRIFTRNPGTWIAMGLVWMIIVIGLSMLPFFSVAATLLSPVFMAGFVAAAANSDQNRPVEFNDLFAGFRSNFGPLLGIGAVYLLGQIAILMVTMAILASVAGPELLEAMRTDGQLQMDPEQAQTTGLLILAGVLIGMALMIPLLMALWFAPALVYRHGYGVGHALRSSLSGCLRNVMPFLIYGLVLIPFSIVAVIPAALGLLILGPVVGISIYTGYKQIFVTNPGEVAA